MKSSEEFRKMLEEIENDSDINTDEILVQILSNITKSETRLRNCITRLSDKVDYIAKNDAAQVNLIADTIKKLDDKQQKQVLEYAEFLLSKK